jgi:pSer/pThr/pTyr-binding forkhead associated (FHA) protein
LAERGRWVLGRGSGCDLTLGYDDDTVSRRHAEIAVRAGLCLIRDLDSCNGTLLNGRPVRRARLRRGDVLLMGETEIRVR